MTTRVWTGPHGGQWVSWVEGQPAFFSSSRKDEAVSAGRARAIQLKCEHLIQGGDGRIQERNSYGNDPFPPRG